MNEKLCDYGVTWLKINMETTKILSFEKLYMYYLGACVSRWAACVGFCASGLSNLVPRAFSSTIFQDGGSSVEDPGTQRTKTITDWCITLRIHTCALIGLFLPKQKWWLPRFFVETENRV